MGHSDPKGAKRFAVSTRLQLLGVKSQLTTAWLSECFTGLRADGGCFTWASRGPFPSHSLGLGAPKCSSVLAKHETGEENRRSHCGLRVGSKLYGKWGAGARILCWAGAAWEQEALWLGWGGML